MKITLRVIDYKGGEGSGDFGHAGIPEHQGGSLPGRGGKVRYHEEDLREFEIENTDKLTKTQYGYGGFVGPNGKLYDTRPTHADFARSVLRMGTPKVLSDEDQKLFEEMGKLRHESEVIAIMNGWDRVDVSGKFDQQETNFQTRMMDTETLRKIQAYKTSGLVKASLDSRVEWEGMLHKDPNFNIKVSNIGYFRGTHSAGGRVSFTWREFLMFDKVKFDDEGVAHFKEKKMKAMFNNQRIILKGGAGSGFHGHRGRPGEIGGSAGGASQGLPKDAEDGIRAALDKSGWTYVENMKLEFTGKSEFGEKVYGVSFTHSANSKYQGLALVQMRDRFDIINSWTRPDTLASIREGRVVPDTFTDIQFKGGEGSGFHGHRGRPGEIGGSAPEGGFLPGPKITMRFGKIYGKSKMINVRKPPKQGAFKSKLADIKDDGTVILKYTEHKQFRKPKYDPVTGGTSEGLDSDYRSDVEAYRAAEQLGFTSLVPRTERQYDPETGEKCAAMEFIKGDLKTVAKTKAMPDLSVDQFSELAVLDTITGNRDRHGGNLLVDQGTGKIHAIDNSLGFHQNLGWHDPGIVAAGKWYKKATKKNDFKVLAKHILAGRGLVHNPRWRKRIVQRFDQAALDRVDVRWADFEQIAVSNGWLNE